jgi:hypothetical protein
MTSHGWMRASAADRDHVIKVIKSSFVEGRLTKAELDLRVGQALVLLNFPQLIALIADLPAGPFGRLPRHPPDRAPRRSGRLAVALVCLTMTLTVVIIAVVVIAA